MSIKSVDRIASLPGFYSLKDKALQFATNKRMADYDRIDRIRQSVDNPEKLAAYQRKNREALKGVIGDFPYGKNFPLNPQITGVIEEENLVIKKIIFQARENVYVTSNLYLPKGLTEKCPAVLLQCGHHENGKACQDYQRAARIIAAAGIAVLVTDPPGQGERAEYVEKNGKAVLTGATRSHQQFGTQCFLTGQLPIGYFLADAIRSVDFLCSLEEVDSDKIGATGISGGGTMTSYLMAMDDRIKAAAPGCWPSAGREYFAVGTAPDCEQNLTNILGNDLDVCEIMTCICPNPLLFLSAKHDFIPIEGVKKLYEETHRLYALAGKCENVMFSFSDSAHGYSAASAKDAAVFFAKHLCGKDYQASDMQGAFLTDAQLRCTKSGVVTLDYENSATVYTQNLAVYNKLTEHKPSQEEIYRFLYAHVYKERQPDTEITFRKRNEFYDDGLWVEAYVWLTHSQMPCCGILFKAAENAGKCVPITLCLWSGGTDNLTANVEKIREICNSGRAAFVVDLTAMGKCSPHPLFPGTDENELLASITDKIAKSLILSGDSLCALNAYDLLQTLQAAKAEFGTEDLELYTKGNLCVLGRIVEVLDPSVTPIFDCEVKVSDIIKNKYYNTYDVARIVMPGIGKYLL